jgi:hypothetical protein
MLRRFLKQAGLRVLVFSRARCRSLKSTFFFFLHFPPARFTQQIAFLIASFNNDVRVEQRQLRLTFRTRQRDAFYLERGFAGFM